MVCAACGIHPAERYLERVDGPGEAELCRGCFGRVALYVSDKATDLERLPGRARTQMWREKGNGQRYFLFRGPPA